MYQQLYVYCLDIHPNLEGGDVEEFLELNEPHT